MNPLYYRPSGEAPVTGILLALFAASLGGALLAIVYAYVIVYIPIAGTITCVLALGFGVGIGAVAARALRLGKVRNTALGVAVGGFASALAFYVSWVFWIYALLHRNDVDAPLAELMFRPGLLWDAIVKLNAIGAWTIKGATPKGALLWALWGGEALLILVPAVLLALGDLSNPFCDRCDRWCDLQKAVRSTEVVDGPELVRRLEAKDWTWVAALGKAGANSRLSYDLHVCLQCGELHTLTVNQVTTKIEDGKPEETSTAVVQHLLIGRSDADALRAGPAAPPLTAG